MGTFGNSTTRACESCDPKCSICTGPTSSDCYRCSTNNYLIKTSFTCTDQCPTTAYTDNTNMLCVDCKLPCLECTESSVKCTKCATGYFY